MKQFHKIGIIGAMVEEIERFLTHIESPEIATFAGIEYISGKMEGLPVVVCKSGVGKVNAAMCAQILIDHFSVDAVMMTGVAGAVDLRLNIGDLVVSNDCMQHDMDVTALGFARGVIPFAEHSLFTADQTLIDAALQAAALESDVQTLVGRVLSGDQFIANREVVTALREKLQGTCTEMEGAAVAQVCYLNQIPFVIIRSISDRADGSAHANFAEFTPLAAERSSRLVHNIIKQVQISVAR
jgi:adenosylhomocysteine nucleosidase